MNMSKMEAKQEGRIPSIAGALKKLFAEDPLLALIALVVLLPLGGLIIVTAGQGQWEKTLLLIACLSLVIMFVCIPLIITKAWKETRNTIKEERLTAINTEAERIRLIEENRQFRFNELMDAKIEALKAQTDYIQSQSDRYDRHLLEKTSKELSDTIMKGFSFVDQEKCSQNVSNILNEFNKVHTDFDSVFTSIKVIEETLNIRKEEPPDIAVVDEVKDPEEQKAEPQTITKDQQIESQSFVISKQLKMLAKRREIIDQLQQENKQLEHEKYRLTEQLDNMKIAKASKVAPIVDSSQPEEIAIQTTWPDKTPAEAEQIKAALSAVDTLEDTHQLPEEESKKWDTGEPMIEPVPKSYWTCVYCNNDNPLKAPRCKKCGKGKAQPSELS